MIVVCGEALIDLTPAQCGPEAGFVPRPGGSPYNVAVALARLDVPTAFLGRLSRDFFGQRLRAHLQANRVDLRHLRAGDEHTPLAFVQIEPGREPQYAFYGENTADRQLLPRDLPADLGEETRAVHFGSLSLVLEPTASTLDGLMRRERGQRLISLDPNVRPGLIANPDAYRQRLEGWVGLADLVKVSRADLAWLYPGKPVEALARRWLVLGPRLIAVTLGEDGAFGLTAGASARVPGERVNLMDSVGAGDAFTAGLLAWLYQAGGLSADGLSGLSQADLVRLLGYANRVAALTCTRPGAEPPHRQELESPPAAPA